MRAPSRLGDSGCFHVDTRPTVNAAHSRARARLDGIRTWRETALSRALSRASVPFRVLSSFLSAALRVLDDRARTRTPQVPARCRRARGGRKEASGKRTEARVSRKEQRVRVYDSDDVVNIRLLSLSFFLRRDSHGNFLPSRFSEVRRARRDRRLMIFRSLRSRSERSIEMNSFSCTCVAR